MAKIVKKTSVLLSAVGAARIGIQTIGSETWTLVQDALEGLNTKVEGRVRSFRLNGSSPLAARPYVNVVSPTASVADNSGLTSTDLLIPDEVFMGVSAPGTPHSYKLWLDTSSSPTVPKRWNSATSTWLKLKTGPNRRGPWAASTAYQVDDLVTYGGSAYLAITDHTSSATPPSSDATNYQVLVEKGAEGAGPGGVHASTHKGDGSDPIASATTSVSGLLSSTDKTKLDGIASGAIADHGAASGLLDDDHTQYALADGSRLTLATSVTSPSVRQLRLNSGVLERWDGAAWTAIQSDLSPLETVPKGQLEALGIDSPDLATNRSIVIHATSATRPTTNVIEGQLVYESDTNNVVKNTSTDPNAPSWGALVPASESYVPPFASQNGAGSLFVAYGDGNPAFAYSLQNQSLAAGPSASKILPTKIRLVRFRVPKTFNISSAIIVGSGVSTAIWKIGIYRVSDSVKVWDSGLFAMSNTTTRTLTGVTLLPDTLYYYALTTSSLADTGVYFRSMPAPYNINLSGVASAVLGNPDVGQPAMYEATTASGALPATLGAVSYAAWDATSGSLPFLFLVGTAT